MPNAVVHFEILGTDGDQLQRFYGEAFGWTINADNPMSYGLTDTGGNGTNGGIGQAESPLATIYIEVDDPAQYLKKVVAAGSSTSMYMGRDCAELFPVAVRDDLSSGVKRLTAIGCLFYEIAKLVCKRGDCG